MNEDIPCRECEHRRIECHADCVLYTEWSARHRELLRQQYQEGRVTARTIDGIKKRHWEWVRKNKK